MNENITTIFLRRRCRTAIANSSLYRYDHGQILKIEGVELPTTYTVDFCNVGDTETMPMIGNADGVTIPDDFLQTGKDILAYIWLTGEGHGETEYEMTIKVKPRQWRGDAEPTPVQQTAIDQLITQLNNGVDHVDEIAESLEASPFAPGGGRESAVLINSSHPNTASGAGAVAFGAGSVASGTSSIAAGTYSGSQATVASGLDALAVGRATTASGNNSQAFGQKTIAEGNMSTAIGNYTHARGDYSLAAGKYNVAESDKAVVIGNGTADNARSNAATLDWDGNAVLSGKLTVGADPTGDMDVATKQYVDDAVARIERLLNSITIEGDVLTSRRGVNE